MSIISYIFIQDFLGKSDPYLELARSKEDGTFVVVHRTEVIDIVVMLFGALIYKKKLHKEPNFFFKVLCDLRSVNMVLVHECSVSLNHSWVHAYE